MDNRIKILKSLFAIVAILLLLAYTPSLDIGETAESKIDEQEDLEAVCVITVMSVY